jgi:hypothetical protein
MAQKNGLLIFLAALGFQAALIEGKAGNPQPSPPAAAPSATPTPVPIAAPTPAPAAAHPVPPATGLENLTPEQRQRFQKNLERWKKLPKVQQDELRREANFHRERILQEINEAIEKTGLKLDEQQRQVFTYRYAQERRTLEEKLRETVEEKRREAISELIWQLSAEFQPLPPDPSGSPKR